MLAPSKHKHQNAETARPVSKDLETCLVIAGCSGAGKSTIVKYSHDLDIKLYGKEFHEDFKKTRNSWPHQEFDDYIEAIKHGSTFEGRHIRELNEEKSPPKHILIHVDLKLLISTLGYYAASENYQKEIASLSKIPIPKKNRGNAEICDLMISSFLKNHFFSRFKRIAVNTIYTDSKTNYWQKIHRDKPKKNINHAKELKMYTRQHRAMYKAWEKHIYLLKPSKILFTTAGKDGALYSNNKCICPNWAAKTGLNQTEKLNAQSFQGTNIGSTTFQAA